MRQACLLPRPAHRPTRASDPNPDAHTAAENEDEEYVRQGKSYRPLSLLITTGPAPVPFLDEGNIVVGQVVGEWQETSEFPL